MSSHTSPRAGALVLSVALLTASLTGACSSTTSNGAVGDTSPSSSTTSSVASSTSTVAASTTTVTTPPTPAPTTPSAALPARPTIISAGSGGGSGELMMEWAAVPGATSYVVYRGPSSSGPWNAVAEINVVTGYVDVDPEVINLFGDAQNFHPGGFSSSGTSTRFTYIELAVDNPAWFKVRAYNSAGQGPSSSAACAALFGTSC